jgi:hypothetical protein
MCDAGTVLPVSRSRSSRMRASAASPIVAKPECHTFRRAPVAGSRWSITTDQLLPRLYTPGGRFGMVAPSQSGGVTIAWVANG